MTAVRSLIEKKLAEKMPYILRNDINYCKNFSSAVQFTNKIADLAEQEDHHPAILLEWGKVEVTWWTHKILGLHMNDFIAAAKTDLIFNQ